MHYPAVMRAAVSPRILVDPQLLTDLESVLQPGETLSEFVESAVRCTVKNRLAQPDFPTRCDASLAAYELSGLSISSAAVLSKLEKKIEARVKQLSP